MNDSDPSTHFANIRWGEQRTPISTQFEDVYFSQFDGLAETQYVFIHHNRLKERWERLDTSSTCQFIIAETGFGTGLNFLASCQAWQQYAPADAKLHFISMEKYPLHHNDLQTALSHWPSLQVLSQQLMKDYPSEFFEGHHFEGLHFEGLHAITINNITLHLLIGDIADCLPKLATGAYPIIGDNSTLKVDAWFLDGFAPAKNPDMWTKTLFDTMQALSRPGSSFATFTAAGAVRRELQASGFQVEKVPGFGQKREMLCGEKS